jgi:hypothetical protein
VSDFLCRFGSTGLFLFVCFVYAGCFVETLVCHWMRGSDAALALSMSVWFPLFFSTKK